MTPIRDLSITDSIQDELAVALQAFQAVKNLENERILYGCDHINFYVDDIDCCWLEEWGIDDKPVYLCDWFQNIFEVGWLKLEELGLSGIPDPLNFLTCWGDDSRSVQRGRWIDLGNDSGVDDVILLLTIHPETDDMISVLIQVLSSETPFYLPEGLTLRLSSSANQNICQEMIADSNSECLQLRWTGEIGQEFTVTISLGNLQIKDRFMT